MIHHFDDQWATFESDGTVRDVTEREKADPDFYVMPRYWVIESEVDAQVDLGSWPVLAWRRNARSTDVRTFIATPLTRAAVGDSIFLGMSEDELWPVLATFTSTFAFDFVVRQKFGGLNMSFYLVQQFPVPLPAKFRQSPSPERSPEVDAWAFLLYGVTRSDAEYILDTFPIVRRGDEQAHGEFRTKRLILESYDALTV